MTKFGTPLKSGGNEYSTLPGSLTAASNLRKLVLGLTEPGVSFWSGEEKVRKVTLEKCSLMFPELNDIKMEGWGVEKQKSRLYSGRKFPFLSR